MKKEISKIIAILIIVALNYAGLSAVGTTFAVFNDTETSEGNTFIAGLVDFDMHTTEFSPISASLNMESGTTTAKSVTVIPHSQSNPFQYSASSTAFLGDIDFCDSLLVNSKEGEVENYNGLLKNFITATTTTFNPWNFTFTTNANLQNKVCSFSVTMNGWQTRHKIPVYGAGGFSDTESTTTVISSWGVRINKVYPNVATDRGTQTQNENEWIELYNQTDVPVDVSGWKICDNDSCDNIPVLTSPIPAKGFGVITASGTTWTYWNMPEGVVRIVLDNKIGNGLADSGDMLILKRPDLVVIDQMNWGDANTGWNNYTADVWNTGVMVPAKGNIITRKITGYDTNTPSDFSIATPPTVDLLSPDEDNNSLTWYWGSSYEIKWNADNKNGDDSELSIDLYSIKDINGNHILDAGDTIHEIALGTENDGVFLWQVPSGFIGNIWVRIVATGKENPLMNDVTTSGKIWDPVPPALLESDLDAVVEAIKEEVKENADALTLGENGAVQIPIEEKTLSRSDLDSATEEAVEEPAVVVAVTNTGKETQEMTEETFIPEAVTIIISAIEQKTIEEEIAEVVVEHAVNDGLIWTDTVEETPAVATKSDVSEVLSVSNEVIQ